MIVSMRLPIAVGFACLVAGAAIAQQAPAPAPAPPQENPPVTFRAEVNYVEVDAVVTDAEGRTVTDLTQADFEVLEDRRAQKISAFALVNIPIDRPQQPLFATAPIEPDVQTNARQEGRIYTIILDDLHTAFGSSPRVKRFLRDFLERNFGDNDLAAVVHTSGRASAGQEFTNNRRLLLAAIDKFSGRRLRSQALEELELLENQSPDDPGALDSRLARDPANAERAHDARSTLTSIRDIAAFLEGIRGRRKAMLFISEGISYDIRDPFNNPSAGVIMQAASDAIAAATRANVAVYAIDPRGLSFMDDAIEATGYFEGAPNQFSLTRRLEDLRRLSQESLATLAEGTGGFAAINRNDLEAAFQRVVRENSTYYVLGYYPTNDRRDGKFRRIEVRVKRPGLQVRSRRGYVAPRGRAPEVKNAGAAVTLDTVVNNALGSPVPLNGIPLRVSAAPFKGPAPNASVMVAIEMAVDGFRFTEKDGKSVDRIEIAHTSVDGAGKQGASVRHVVGMDMRPETIAVAREAGFRVVTEMALPPGRYQLRIAAGEENAGKSGSVYYDVDVPDFQKSEFAMSGVAVASAEASRLPTARASNALNTILPGPPTAVREFSRKDQLALFAEVYINRPAAPTYTVELSTTVRTNDGRVVFENREERSSADLEGGKGGFGYAPRLSLAEFAPGTYVIRLEARAEGVAAPTGRDVLIRVR